MSERLPTVTSPIPRDLRVYLDRLRDIIAAQGEAKLATMGDLARGAGGGSGSGSGSGSAPGGAGGLPVLPPPTPTGLTASPAFHNVILTWDAPTYSGHAYTEVWAASTDVLGSAVLVGMSPGAIYVDDIGPGSTKYYWVRFVNTGGLRGPYNAVSGTVATTATDVAYMLDLLEGQLTGLQLHAALAARIDLIDGPVGTPGTLPYQIAALQGQINDLNSTPAYDNATTYSVGDMVTYGGKLYVAEATTTGNLPTDPAYWLELGDYSALADAVALQATQISTLTTDLAAEVSARTLLAATVSSNTAAIATESTARATADTAMASDISTLFVDVSDNTAAIGAEALARANADSSLASQISTVSATAAGKNRIYRQTLAPTNTPPGTLVTGDLWFDSDSNNLVYRWSGTAWIDTSDVRITTNAAAIVSEATARANADSALAVQVTALEADIGDVSAAVSTEAIARADGDAAGAASLASAVTTLQARINANTGISTRLYWGYDTTLEGWAPGNATAMVTGGRVTWTPTVANPNWSRALAGGEQYVGSLAPVVRAKVRRVSGTGAWEGRLYYSTAGHGFTGSYYRQIVQPADVTAWNELEWNMAALTAGGTDYVSNTITGLRLDLVSDATSVWEIDWIGVGEATVTPVMVSIQQESVVRASETGELFASYTVKIDNNGYVSGFGMASTGNTGVPSSAFAIRADSFFVASPSGPGVPPSMPFIVRTTETVVGGEIVPVGVYMHDAYIANGTITKAKIADLAVDDAKIATLSAAKITAGAIAVGEHIQSSNYMPNLQGWRITGAGDIELNNAFVRGEVIANGVDGGYARMFGGNFEIYKNVPGVGVVPYKALSRIEVGIANSGVRTTIPGYFRQRPTVIVSPNNVLTYSAAHNTQSQALQCNAINLSETNPGSMVWQFDPVATLMISGADNYAAVSIASGAVSSPWVSGSVGSTPFNGSQTRADITVQSRRQSSSSTSGYTRYHRRAVRARIEASSGGGVWVPGGWVSSTLPLDTGAWTSLRVESPVLPPATYQSRVRVESADLASVIGQPDWPAVVEDNRIFSATSPTGGFACTSANAPHTSNGKFVRAPQCTGVAFSGSTFVAVSGTTSYISGDGVSWLGLYESSANGLMSVVWHVDKFVAVGVGPTHYEIRTSPTGAVWTTRHQIAALSTGGATLLTDFTLATNGGTVVVAGGASRTGGAGYEIILSSSDGGTWYVRRSVTVGDGAGIHGNVVYNGSVFATAARDSRYSTGTQVFMLTSADGVTWQRVLRSLPAPTDGEGSSALVVLGGNPGQLLGTKQFDPPKYYSADFPGLAAHDLMISNDSGATWARVTGSPKGMTAVRWDGTQYVGFALGVVDFSLWNTGYAQGGMSTKVFTSADGATWVERQALPGFTAHDVVVTPSRTVAVGMGIVWGEVALPGAPLPTRDNHNVFGYGYSLATSEVLATGTLNWVAVGD
ncbi:MAG: DUF1983 domain-containing protein [Sulfuricella sp.]